MHGEKASATTEERARTGADATASTLAAGLTVLAGGLGAFGSVTGSAARMARNHETATAVSVGLVLASVVLALASRLVSWEVMVWRWRLYRILLWSALIVFLAGVALALGQLNATLGEDDRPSIDARLSVDAGGTLLLSGTAETGGLAAKDRIYISVVSFEGDVPQGEQSYYALVGPNQDGVVHSSFSVVVQPKVTATVVSVGKVTRYNAKSNAENNLSRTCEPPMPAAAGQKVRPSDKVLACAFVRTPRP